VRGAAVAFDAAVRDDDDAMRHLVGHAPPDLTAAGVAPGFREASVAYGASLANPAVRSAEFARGPSSAAPAPAGA
jgi:hypothetical protein